MDDEPESVGPKAPLGGYLAWWPFAAALGAAVALVTAVVLINVFAGGGTTGSRQQGDGLTAGGAVACPTFYEHVQPTVGTPYPWVPAKPAGVHAKNRMVPKLHPTHVSICQYLDRSSAEAKSLRLTGQRTLGGTLDRVIDTLRHVPANPHGSSSCLAELTPANTDQYLIGLRYAEAIVWVSAPKDRCAGASNGTFSTAENLSGYAAASYAARRWVSAG